MKKFIAIFLTLTIALLLSLYCLAANNRQSYFSVYYESEKRMKIGIVYDNSTTYYDYIPNVSMNYLPLGNGKHTIIVYEQAQSNRYKVISKETIIISNYSTQTYTYSTFDAYFNNNDDICQIASALCKNKKNNQEKVDEIVKYIENNIYYDYNLANKIKNGDVKWYIPFPLRTLISKKGICYDAASLCAAMCRSQNIPCKIEKGYLANGDYHAWNNIYIDNDWIKIDIKLKKE